MPATSPGRADYARLDNTSEPVEGQRVRREIDMKRLRRFRPSPAMAVACLALLVALGGTSIAAVNALPANSVGTAQLKNNAVNSQKVRNNSLLEEDFAPGVLPPATLWAVVWPNGVVQRSSGFTSVARDADGTMTVSFNRDVSGCAYVATVGNPSNRGIYLGTASVSIDPMTPNAVLVHALNSANKQIEAPFYLAVFC